LFGDVLFNGKGRVLSSPQSDLYIHFTAWRQFSFDQLRQGHLPLWNPHYLCGAPFFGNFESALLYPPNWLYLLFPLSAAINIGIILHVFLAGWFAFIWAKNRNLHPLSCLMVGAVYMFCGAFYLHLFAGHLPNLCTMVWAPLIFLSMDGLLKKIEPRWFLLGIFAVSMQILAGHPQYVYFTGIISFFYLLLNMDGTRNKWAPLLSLFAVYSGAFMIAAVQLWTGLQALSECGRNIPMEYNTAASFSLPPENLITFFLPEFFGNLTSTHYWGRWYLWEVSLFIGATPTLFAFLGIAGGERGKIKGLLATAIIALLFSMGAFTPFYRILYFYAPGFNELRGLCKFDFLACLLLSGIAGVGLDSLLHNKKKYDRAFFIAFVMATVLIGGEVFILYSLRNGLSGSWAQWFCSRDWLKGSLIHMDAVSKEQYVHDSGIHSALALLLGGLVYTLLAALLSLRKHIPSLPSIIVAIALIELFAFARINRPTFELSQFQKKIQQINDFYRENPGEFRVYGTASSALLTGGFDIWEDEPMVLGRYGRFVCFSQGLAESQLFSKAPLFSRFTKIFGLIRLKYILNTDYAQLQVYPMPFKTLPRMFLVNQWVREPDSQKTLSGLLDPEFDPEKKIYLEDVPVPTPSAKKGRNSLQWKDLSTDKIEIEANLTEPMILLITDNFSSGWRAKPYPESVQSNYQVMPGDYFLRAIPLSQGKQHFLLEYRPLAFEVGKWVSILSCIFYLVMLLFCWKKGFLYPLKAIP